MEKDMNFVLEKYGKLVALLYKPCICWCDICQCNHTLESRLVVGCVDVHTAVTGATLQASMVSAKSLRLIPIPMLRKTTQAGSCHNGSFRRQSATTTNHEPYHRSLL